jgi:hypothetical protein
VYFKITSQGYYDNFSVHKELQFLKVKCSSSVSLKCIIFKDNSILHNLDNCGGVEIWFFYSQNFTNSHFHFSVIVESVIGDTILRFPESVSSLAQHSIIFFFYSALPGLPITMDVPPNQFRSLHHFLSYCTVIKPSLYTCKYWPGTGHEFGRKIYFAHIEP